MRSDKAFAMLYFFYYFEKDGDRFDLLNDQTTWLVPDNGIQVT